MNINGTMGAARRQRRTRQQGTEPYVLPQRVIDSIATVGLAISRLLWRIRYVGLENVPSTGGLIIAANHQTYIDPFWVGFPLRRPLRFLAWDAIFTWPVIGTLTRLLGAWPLQVEKSDPGAIRRALQWLASGGALVIFPEGARVVDCSAERFKAGAARLALEAKVPILPVTIRGGQNVWPKGKRFPRFAQIEIIYHPVHYLTQQSGEPARCCARRETDELASIIRASI